MTLERAITPTTGEGRPASRTVREAAFDVLRARGLTTIVAGPGSTEVPFLAGLPVDLRFVLALHEASVVGMATGWALGTGEPALEPFLAEVVPGPAGRREPLLLEVAVEPDPESAP